MSDHSNSEIPNGSYYVDVAVLAKIFAKRYGTSVNAAYEWLTKDVEAPSANVQPVVHCKDCKWWGYDDDDGTVRVCHAAKHGHMSSNWSIMIYRTHRGDFYCADAERRTDAD